MGIYTVNTKLLTIDGRMLVTRSIPSLHPETVEYLATVESLNDTLSDYALTSIDDSIKEAYTLGIRQYFLNLWIPLSDGFNGSMAQLFFNEDGSTKVLGQKVLTNVGFVEDDYGQFTGLQGRTSKCLKTGFVPSSIIELEADKAGTFVYSNTKIPAGVFCGTIGGGFQSGRLQPVASILYAESDNSLDNLGALPFLSFGYRVGNSKRVLKDGTIPSTQVNKNFTGKSTKEDVYFALNNNGSIIAPTNNTISAIGKTNNIPDDATAQLISDWLNKLLKKFNRNEYALTTAQIDARLLAEKTKYTTTPPTADVTLDYTQRLNEAPSAIGYQYILDLYQIFTDAGYTLTVNTF